MIKSTTSTAWTAKRHGQNVSPPPKLQKAIIVSPQHLEDINCEVIMEAVIVLKSEENLNVTEGFEI